MRLYRGIKVGAEQFEEVCSDIRADGLRLTNKSFWKFSEVDLRPHIEELLVKPYLSTGDTRPSRWVNTLKGGERVLIGEFPVICACGDELGATYYATRHNRSNEKNRAILIEFEADAEDLHVDGRDSLYNFVFQKDLSKGQRSCALQLFGSALARYLDSASHQQAARRLALCDLAVQDLAVVEQHYSNKIVIGGRYETVFRSAFFVRLPVGPERIVTVSSPRDMTFIPEITVERFRSL